MRNIMLTSVSIFIFVFTIYSQGKTQNIKLNSYQDSLSYIIGRDVGAQLKELETNVKISPFSMGVEQALNGKPSLIDSTRADSIRRQFSSEVQEKLTKKQAELADENKKKSDTFLAANKKKPNVQTTASGLQYIVISKGRGNKPTRSDSVKVNYRGMLIDSTVFDSTMSGNPVSLDLQRVIPGLSEGIQLMNVGSKYRFFIPPDLAYGPSGAPPAIPPNAALIFDITLQEIIGKEMKSRY
ncbi:MAG TPA: FKBP-type peptidyl-prolyl cis-trans isomerase [Chitinispirillaceae bacterium]|nr:FKBP-type peptidyl-prolyl cis-trans isomerase [Chitinispirillaceae bacterium]